MPTFIDPATAIEGGIMRPGVEQEFEVFSVRESALGIPREEHIGTVYAPLAPIAIGRIMSAKPGYRFGYKLSLADTFYVTATGRFIEN